MSDPNGIRSTKVDSLSDYLIKVERLTTAPKNADPFLFRGQSLDKPLLPRLARGLFPSSKLPDIEHKMFEEFSRASLPLGDFIVTQKWDLLSLAQHHGMATRLLDWTTNALAGLWYAVWNKQQGDSEPAIVWLLKTKDDDFIDVEKHESPFGITATGVHRPKTITRRIAAQRGLFTAHVMSEHGICEALDENKRFSGRLEKFIPSSICSDMQQQLDKCGVNRFSLFPDLDGLCAHLEWRHIISDGPGESSRNGSAAQVSASVLQGSVPTATP
jgi:FRG domain